MNTICSMPHPLPPTHCHFHQLNAHKQVWRQSPRASKTNSKICYILSRVTVTLDVVLYWTLDLLTTHG
jgi:hypothetical protein